MVYSDTRKLLSDWNNILTNEIQLNRLVGAAVVYHDGVENNHILVGHTGKSRNECITLNTKFEIASLTKIFTGLLCAKHILKNRLSLDSKISDFNLGKLSLDVSNITIRELITHSSGLPRIPQNIKPLNPLNPYNDYTKEMMIDELKKLSISSKEYCYSNFGYAILGKILSEVGENDICIQFDNLFNELELFETSSYQKDSKEIISDAHNLKLEKVPHWDSLIFNTSVGVVSTAHDLSRFSKLILRPKNSRLEKEILLSLSTLYQSENFNVAMGWHIYEKSTLLSHDGATYGHYAKIRIAPLKKRFLICLSNTYNEMENIEMMLE